MPGATVTTGSVDIKSSTEVSLSGSFSEATDTPREVGFYYGTTSSSMNNKVKASSSVYGTEGDFTVDLSGLTPEQTYCFKAYAKVCGTGSYALQETEVESDCGYFTMPKKPVDPAVNQTWLELPGKVSGSTYEVNTYYDGSTRNYTHLYDVATCTSLWTAYPLNSSYMGSYERPDTWSYSPSISSDCQPNLCDRSYANSSTHSRGHMIPNASRNGNQTMQLQTFYVTNSVPQLQNSFNSGIWSNLEAALQSIAGSETIYIVTGVAFNKVGESRTVEYTAAKDPSTDNEIKQCPIPNYFYKVVLKVEQSGSTVTSACAVGFWFEHKAYSDNYTNYTVSVNQIEAWTGFDFFVNLPDSIEESAETNSNWTTFSAF